MTLKQWIKRAVQRTGYSIERLPIQTSVYDQDGLWTVHNHEFMQDPRFMAAYRRGVEAAVGLEYLGHWRVHIGLWAASHAIKLQGDFVECGVNRGVLSSAIMQYLSWNERGRRFFLLDTFAGLDLAQLTEGERARGAIATNSEFLDTGRYVSGVESVRANFSEWQNVRLVEGRIPDTLREVDADKLAYLHLDLNSTRPEVEALTFFWERLVPGAVVLLDDYAFDGYRESKLGMDAFAREHGVDIASLPTGQGLIFEAPASMSSEPEARPATAREAERIVVLCPKYYPTEEGLAHYTTEFCRHLAKRFRVAVWTSSVSAGVDHGAVGVQVIGNVGRWGFLGPFFALAPVLRFDPDYVLIQFVPFMYAKRGGINFTLVLLALFLALRSRIRGRGSVHVMFHETWFPFSWNAKAIVMTLSHRCMAFGVSIGARQIFCSTVIAARMVKDLLRPFVRPVHVLVVGSNLERDVRASVGPQAPRASLRIGVFGSMHPSKNVPLVLRALHDAQARAQRPLEVTVISLTLQELVREMPELSSWLENEVRVTGLLSAEAAADLLGEQDVAVCYFSDGVSGRRGSMLAALCEGTPIITTSREYTDPIFYGQRVFELLSSDERVFGSELVALLSAERRPFEGVSREEVREFYRTHFSWAAIVERYALLIGAGEPANTRGR